MKITKEQLTKIEKFAKEKISKNDSLHNLNHIQRTVKIARFLAKKEKTDIKKSMIIAWLHDIEKNKQSKKISHGIEGAKTAKKFLNQIGLEKKDIEEICYAISKHNTGEKQKTKEARIIWDADKLQAFGLEGILRIYAWFMLQGLKSSEAYNKILPEQKFYIQRFRTKTGKKIALKRFKFLKKITKRYQKEMRLKL
tara:strand:+ start:293 stop:880 length:588 start_codon:yes stop_codon:yes gene_type:complete